MFDTAINNGVVIDPVDGEYASNIGISNGKIVTVSNNFLEGKRVIDAKGMKVAPGFIDIHMHGGEISTPSRIDTEMFNYMALMGVTTCAGGNCGLGDPGIFAFKKENLPVNYLGFLGHGSLREKAGLRDRYGSAQKNHIEKMAAALEEGLKSGAVGLSFGLEYIPGTSTEELLQLSRVVSRHPGKLVSAHYRFDATRSLEALAELIIVARETKVKFQISHINSCTAFGQMQEGLSMLAAASEAGVDIRADAYPYDAFSTFVGSAVFDEGCFENWGAGYDAIEVCEGKYKGKRCTEEIFNYIRENEPDNLVIAFVMNEDEVVEAIRHPLVMVASDGYIKDGQGHPRAAGAFPRLLGRYVREDNCLDLVTAVKKATLMPAERLGLKSKGRVKEGFDADITVFDSENIRDKATFQDPTRPPCGIEYVLVNGEEAVKESRLTDRLTGRFMS